MLLWKQNLSKENVMESTFEDEMIIKKIKIVPLSTRISQVN